jgi:hypothetical protein
VTPSTTTAIRGSTVTVTVELPVTTSGIAVYLPTTDGVQGAGTCPAALRGDCLSITGNLDLYGPADSVGGVLQFDVSVDVNYPTDVLSVQAVIPTANAVYLSEAVTINVIDGLQCDTTGMTWAPEGIDAALDVERYGCSGCDPYQGDHACTDALPLLCLRDDGDPDPGVSGYWAGGAVALTAPVQGCALTDAAAANQICEDQLGAGYRWAEFHDGSGWHFWGYGNVSFEHTCDDSQDEDGDGLYDCDDSDCVDDAACNEAVCDDNFDGDGDGIQDCDDPDCKNDAACAAYSYEEDCTDAGNASREDDDGDGLVNCDDPDCWESSVCMTERRFWVYIDDQVNGNCWQ